VAKKAKIAPGWTPTLSWPPLSVKDALQLIVRKSDVGPKDAQILLVKACASKRVRSCYLAIFEGPATVTAQSPYMDSYLADESLNTVMVGTIAIDPRRMQFEYRTIDPKEWDRATVPSSSIDLTDGTFRAGDVQGSIGINATDLCRWLARRPRGPQAGTVGYAEADRALFSEITRLIREGKARSPTDAVNLLMKAGKEIPGYGLEGNRVKRVVKAYLAEN
jgi:hypothetical protein